jgi:thioredoxin-related protein
MKYMILAMLMAPLVLVAQKKGVDFTQDMSWLDILQKAKTEHKYIFVDCYATWCGPCKYMDDSVYTNGMVGEFTGERFVCVKVQMDTTKSDDSTVQNWYATAHWIGEQYHVQSYPTFLFLSAEGNIVHKALGACRIPDFVKLLQVATNPREQYYRLLDAYRVGKKDYAAMPYLALTSRMLQDEQMAEAIAEDYIHSYLETLPDERLFANENLQFIWGYWMIVKSKDKLFGAIRRNVRAIDSVMNNSGYTARMVNELIYREEVGSQVEKAIYDGKEPRWSELERSIKKKFGMDYVQKNVIKGRVSFYKARKQWRDYVQYLFRKVRLEGFDSTQPLWVQGVIMNDDCYEIFKYSRDRQQLQMALSWVDHALALMTKPNGETLDTKANLLYKLGRKEEGLELEEQSYKLSPRNKDISENYQKMKSGLPTWYED